MAVISWFIVSIGLGIKKAVDLKSKQDGLFSAVIPLYGLIYFFVKEGKDELILTSYRSIIKFKGRSRRKRTSGAYGSLLDSCCHYVSISGKLWVCDDWPPNYYL